MDSAENGAGAAAAAADGNTRHLPIAFFTNHKGIAVPAGSYSVPATSGAVELNAFLKQLCIDAGDPPPPPCDFLAEGVLLRVALGELLDSLDGVDAESDVRLECVLKARPPEAKFDTDCEDWVAAVAQTEQFIACACYDGGVRTVRAAGGGVAHCDRSRHADAVKCVLAMAGGERFVTGSTDMTIAQWTWPSEGAPPRCEGVYRGHERSVECLACNAAGDRLASGSFDAMLKVWNTGEEKGDGRAETASPSSSTTSAGGKAMRAKSGLFSKTPMVTLSGHREAVTGAAWPAELAANVATCSFDHSIIVWDLELAGQSARLVGERAHTSLAACVDSPHVLATGSTDRHVRLWDTRSNEGSLVKGTFTSHTGWVSSVCWAPAGRPDHFASASYDKLVKIWDRRSARAPLYDLSGHGDKVLDVDWACGRIASGSADATVKVFHDADAPH